MCIRDSACRWLDEQLTKLSSDLFWQYTRYADDMTFSSNRPIELDMIHSVRQIVEKAGFIVNERKVKRFGPADDKIVTGLLVTDKVTLAADFIPSLQAELVRLKTVFHAQNEQGRLSTKWADDLKLQVRGRLNFAGFVLGRNHKIYIDLKDKFYEAIHPPEEEFNAVSWRGFPYL